jgi:hypothetical protein
MDEDISAIPAMMAARNVARDSRAAGTRAAAGIRVAEGEVRGRR